MMNEINKNLQNMEIQQLQMKMFGLNIDAKSKISMDEIKKIKQNYVGMYYGFVSVNWGRGMTLGMAWQKALEQMDAFIGGKTKTPNHSLNKILTQIHSDFRREMAKTIMDSHYADEKLNPQYAAGFVNHGAKRISETKDFLNNVYKKYMPEKTEQKQPQVKSFDIAKQNAQKLMQQMMLEQIIKQRAA